jgi:TetR/AcrR family transcriptional regulator, repressor for uid operon
MPRIDAKRKAERRAQIIDAASTCFARSGFHKATLQDVLVEAGLSAGCVYSYFRSKDELILAIAEERHEDERHMISQAALIDDPIEALQYIAKAFADKYLTRKSVGKRRIALQTWAETQVNPAVLTSVREGLDEPRVQLARLIRRAQAAERLTTTLPANAIAQMIIAMFQGLLLQRLWSPDIDRKSHLAVFEHFLRSLQAATVSK